MLNLNRRSNRPGARPQRYDAVVFYAEERASGHKAIGRTLVESHLARLRNVRVKALFLEVGEENLPARKLYAGLGFVEVGRRKNYYRTADSSEQMAALVLRHNIDPTQRRGWDA